MKKCYTSRLPLLALHLLAIIQLASGQSDWGSDWKFFRSDYIFDKEMYEDQQLKSDWVNAADWYEDGSYWFAIRDEIKVYHNKQLETINSKKYGSPRAVTALKWDQSGTLWIGTTSGLFAMGQDGEFTYVDVPNTGVITEIAIAPNNYVWVAGYTSEAINASASGVSVFNGESWVNYNKKNGDFPRKFIEDMAFDKNGNLWASNGREDNGVVMFNGKEWKFFNKENSGLESNQVRAIAFDSQNNAWFGTPKGLAKFDGITWTNYSLKDLITGGQFNSLAKFIDEPDLLSIAIDQHDVLWVGTVGDGVIRVKGDGKTLFTVDNSPLTSNYVRKILVDDLNRKWFMTGFYPENWGDRFSQEFDASSFKGVVVYQEPFYEMYKDWVVMNTVTADIPGNSFMEIEKGENGSMWLASPSYGLIRYEAGTWRIYQDPNRGTVGEMLNCMAVSGDEAYAGAQMKGLYVKEGDALRSIPQEELGYDKKTFTDLEFDDQGNLWLAHIAGVNVCKDGTCKSITKKNGLLSNNVFALRKDSKGRMWVCTTKGVSIYDNGNWTFYDKKQGGLRGYVYDVIEDATGTYWAGTGKGLFKLEGDQWTEVKPHGPDVPSFLSVKCMAFDQDGALWIGSTSNSVYVKHADGTWSHYNYTNSGVLFGQIWDIAVADNGDVWIALDKGGSVAKTASYSGGMPASAPDPGYELKQEIIKFDPSAALVIYKKTREE
jgi:ligand-binding sensor domain-containing protein